MTRRTNIIGLVACTLLLGACAETMECSKPKLYQQAVAGKRVEVPDGLDSLTPEKELPVPKASPQAPPPPGACLDAPPTLRTGSSES